MKKLLFVFLAVTLCATAAMADNIGWTSTVGIVGDGAGNVTFTFNAGPINLAINPNTNTTDASLVANGNANYATTFTPNTSSTTTFNAFTGAFNPANSPLTLGDSTDGQLTGTLQSSDLESIGTGNFAITLTFTGATYTAGTSGTDQTLVSFASPNIGAGSLTYQFHVTGATTVADLQTYNGSGTSNYSASLNPVPEPASLALLGSGLLAGGGFIRRKLVPRG